MSKNTYIIIGIIVVIGLAGFFLLQSSPAPQVGGGKEEERIVPPQVGSATHVVIYTDEGYSPREITVQEQDTIVFKNQSTQAMWPATAIHPTHTVYPGSDIQKCGTVEQPRIFDACTALALGESWSFRFVQVGSWGYHDHVAPIHTGKVIVE